MRHPDNEHQLGKSRNSENPCPLRKEWSHGEIPRMLSSRPAGEVLVSIEISMDNALAIWPKGTPCGVLQVRSSAEGRFPARETKGVEGS
jgi:hypothetical protein